MKKSILAVILPLALLAADSQPLLTAEVAYAKPVEFDYDKDGTPDRIQMWATVHIQKGAQGYSGYLRRYMKDVKSGKAVWGYADINMLPSQPYGAKLPVSEVEVHGKTVLFKAGSKHFTFFDGGEGYKNDTIIVNDGNRDYYVELYAGDVRITP